MDPLKNKIQDLPFTEELKTILKAHNILTVQELVDMPVYDWHKKITGFNYHHQYEVVAYLEDQDLADLIKED